MNLDDVVAHAKATVDRHATSRGIPPFDSPLRTRRYARDASGQLYDITDADRARYEWIDVTCLDDPADGHVYARCSPQITYDRDNYRAVAAFVGPQPACPTCGGYGEYETDRGPMGCGPCNSRLIVIRSQTPPLDVDWGDTVVRLTDGTFAVERGPQR